VTATKEARAGNKTRENEVDVAAFLDKLSDAGQRADAHALIALFQRLSGAPPKMWGESIIGFGRYHYRYGSGHQGDTFRIGFSPRKGQTVIYIMPGFPNHAQMMGQLSKHKNPGVGCLYIKSLSEVNMETLEELCTASLAYVNEKFPSGD